jgi:hypothetical protein
MKKNNSLASGSIVILVSPWEKGFTCSILSDDTKFGMNSKEYELCNTIAKGMCCAANENPDKIFKLGLKVLKSKKIKKNLHYLSLPKEDNSNVVDFLHHLRVKDEREKN